MARGTREIVGNGGVYYVHHLLYSTVQYLTSLVKDQRAAIDKPPGWP